MQKKICCVVVLLLLILSSFLAMGKSEKNDFELSINEIKNVSIKSTTSVYSPPIVVIEYPYEKNRTYCYPDISVSGYGEDDHGVVTFKILYEYTGGQIISILDLFREYPHADFSMPITLHEGWNKITVTAYDIGGEHGEDSIIARYNSAPDTTPPTLVIEYSPCGSIHFRSKITVKIIATDNCGVVIPTVMHNSSDGVLIINRGPFIYFPICDTFNYNFTLGEGLNTIKAWAYDMAGNEKVVSVNIFYIRAKDIKTSNANFPSFTFLTIYKYLIQRFPFFEKILNQ